MIKDILRLLAVGAVLFAAGFGLKWIGLTDASAEAQATGEGLQIAFTVEDSLTLYAWLSEPEPDSAAPDKKPGLTLLMPMLSRTHTSYRPFTSRLVENGYAVLAFDMRGHGLSTDAAGKILSYASMDTTEFMKMPDDIQTAFTGFKNANPGRFDYGDVVVIGASIGANTAAALLDRPWVGRAVLLSPGRNYRGLQPEKTMTGGDAETGKPVYIAAAEDDSYSAESSQWLFDNYDGPKVLKMYPGQDHGTNILLNVKDADAELLDWLKK